MDGIDSTESVEFCVDFRSGWKFRILPSPGYNGVATEGSVLRLFNFRQPGWRREQPNRIGFELVLRSPDIPNLYEVHISDGEQVYDRSGKRTYFLWGRDIRTPLGAHGPYGSKWNPVRFIRCLTLADHGCITYYNAIVCSDYRYPNRPVPASSKPVEPIISISTQDPEASEDLLENFDIAHDLIEEALERILEHSCR